MDVAWIQGCKTEDKKQFQLKVPNIIHQPFVHGQLGVQWAVTVVPLLLFAFFRLLLWGQRGILGVFTDCPGN